MNENDDSTPPTHNDAAPFSTAPLEAAPLPGPTPALPAVPAPRARLGVGGAILIAIAVLITVGCIAAFALLSLNQQRVRDQIAIWNFTPSAAVEAHVERTTMTEEGRLLYFASEPVVIPEETFDPICSEVEGAGILGCYLTGYQQIFLYEVTDERLDGAEDVTAAHEMLHAAWDRMSVSDRDALVPLLEAEVTKRADDEELAETLKFYAEVEPGERANELHSIIGTQFADVGAELEEHYAEYFNDRSAVTGLNETSQAVIRDQIAQGEALIAKLEELDASITADYAAYNSGYDQVNLDIDSFNSRADSGDFPSQAQFDAERAALLARGTDLDALYTSIDARAEEYEALRLQLEELSAVVDDLNAALNIDPPRSPNE